MCLLKQPSIKRRLRNMPFNSTDFCLQPRWPDEGIRAILKPRRLVTYVLWMLSLFQPSSSLLPDYYIQRVEECAPGNWTSQQGRARHNIRRYPTRWPNKIILPWSPQIASPIYLFFYSSQLLTPILKYKQMMKYHQIAAENFLI